MDYKGKTVCEATLNCLYPLEIECTASVDPVDAVNDVSPQKTNEEPQLPGDVEPQSRPEGSSATC